MKDSLKYLAISALLLLSIFSCNNDKVRGRNHPDYKERRKNYSDYKVEDIITSGGRTYSSTGAIDYHSGGMHYKVFVTYGGGLHVVNITKDSLETQIALRHVTEETR